MVSGNYLVLDAENTVTCSYDGGNSTTLSTDDYQYLLKLNKKKPITVQVSGKEEASITLDISEIELELKIGG